MKNALLITAALFLAIGFVISLTIGVSPLVLAFVIPAVILAGLSVYYDRIKQYVLAHKQGIYLAACHSKIHILQIAGINFYLLLRKMDMSPEEREKEESLRRVQDLSNKLQEFNMYAVYLTKAAPWPVFPEDKDDAYVDNAMEHYHGEIEGTRGYIQDEVDVLYNNAIPEEWDRALETITNRYGHDVSDPNICWYDQPNNETNEEV